MRIVFMGTPEFSVTALEALAAAGHEIVAVYSQPPRKSGRGLETTALAGASAWLRRVAGPYLHAGGLS